MKSQHVYVIRSEIDDRFYVRMTSNIEKRVKEHTSGRTKSTIGLYPGVFFSEVYIYKYREEARKREKYLKSGYGKKWIKEKWFRSSAG